MFVRRIGDAELTRVAGFPFQQIYPAGGEDLTDWGVGRTVLETGESTLVHAHEENEMFLFTAGTARFEVDGEFRDVSAGEVVLVPHGSPHQISNIDPAGRVEFFNVYWPASFGRIEL
jgi:mannose-6-phosphate isomerase-like protein (cupin superfamily)